MHDKLCPCAVADPLDAERAVAFLLVVSSRSSGSAYSAVRSCRTWRRPCIRQVTAATTMDASRLRCRGRQEPDQGLHIKRRRWWPACGTAKLADDRSWTFRQLALRVRRAAANLPALACITPLARLAASIVGASPYSRRSVHTRPQRGPRSIQRMCREEPKGTPLSWRLQPRRARSATNPHGDWLVIRVAFRHYYP